MRGGNSFTLHVHCIGGLEIKSPSPFRSKWRERKDEKMLSHRGRRETLLESNRGWQWKRKWAAGPRVRTEAEEHLRICKKAPFESCPSLLCRETPATSHWVPPSPSSSCAPLPSTPLLTTLICYDGGVTTNISDSREILLSLLSRWGDGVGPHGECKHHLPHVRPSQAPLHAQLTTTLRHRS